MRNRSLDIAKGVSLLFIMMAHSCGFPFGLGGFCTAYFVAVFFLISGYLQTDRFSVKEYILRRLKKIILPYFVYNFLILLIYSVWHKFDSVKEFVLAIEGIFYSNHCLYYPIQTENNIFFFRIENDPTWFLTAFFCANMVFMMYMKYCTKIIYKVCALMVCIILTQGLAIFPVFLPWSMDKAFIGAAFMIIGFELQRIKIFDEDNGWSKLALLIVICIAAGSYKFLVTYNPGVGMSTREYGSHEIIGAALYVLIGFSGSVLCILLSRILDHIWLVREVFAAIGREGLVIMSMHLIIFRIFDCYFLKGWEGKSVQFFWLKALFRICFAVGLIMISVYGGRYISKGKSRK